MTRKTIKSLEEHLNKQSSEIGSLREELYDSRERVKVIAAENESLRADKKWLQQMHSSLLQATHELFRSK